MSDDSGNTKVIIWNHDEKEQAHREGMKEGEESATKKHKNKIYEMLQGSEEEFDKHAKRVLALTVLFIFWTAGICFLELSPKALFNNQGGLVILAFVTFIYGSFCYGWKTLEKTYEQLRWS